MYVLIFDPIGTPRAKVAKQLSEAVQALHGVYAETDIRLVNYVQHKTACLNSDCPRAYRIIPWNQGGKLRLVISCDLQQVATIQQLGPRLTDAGLQLEIR